MFGLEDIMKNVDLGDILEKVGLSDSDKEAVTNQAADAVKYRTNKEAAKGNTNATPMAHLWTGRSCPTLRPSGKRKPVQ
jgi:hypothetical protein